MADRRLAENKFTFHNISLLFDFFFFNVSMGISVITFKTKNPILIFGNKILLWKKKQILISLLNYSFWVYISSESEFESSELESEAA